MCKVLLKEKIRIEIVKIREAVEEFMDVLDETLEPYTEVERLIKEVLEVEEKYGVTTEINAYEMLKNTLLDIVSEDGDFEEIFISFDERIGNIKELEDDKNKEIILNVTSKIEEIQRIYNEDYLDDREDFEKMLNKMVDSLDELTEDL